MATAEAPVMDGAFDIARRPLRWLDARTTLESFGLVTFDVDPDRLAAVLPAPLQPEVRRLDDGRERGFVSAVSFRDVDFRFASAPFIRASFFQTNYRAYVRGPDGRRAVYFFGTTLDSGLVSLPRRAWGMPWRGGRTRIEAAWSGDDGRCVSYRHRCAGRWGGADVELTGTGRPLERLDGFTDVDDGALVLTHPLDGWYERPGGRLGRYSVWHPRLEPEMGIAGRARYAVFEELGLVRPGSVPHSVLLQRSVEFDVHLPPMF
jgi:hypothetical protein